MSRSIAVLYDDRPTAERAYHELLEAGMQPREVEVLSTGPHVRVGSLQQTWSSLTSNLPPSLVYVGALASVMLAVVALACLVLPPVALVVTVGSAFLGGTVGAVATGAWNILQTRLSGGARPPAVLLLSTGRWEMAGVVDAFASAPAAFTESPTQRLVMEEDEPTLHDPGNYVPEWEQVTECHAESALEALPMSGDPDADPRQIDAPS